ncbi:MAG TPA: TPM domain-containing protein [Caulobacteraceae bacterium]|jgi:putative membrane protein
MLSTLDEDRITEAVSRCETATDGEILVVLAEEVSRYREIPLAWAAAFALALPPIVLSLSIQPLADFAASLWLTGQAAATGEALAIALGLYAAIQIVLFLAVLAVVHIPAVRRVLTPKLLKRHRVAKAAHHQFAAVSARAVGSATGVLIFVALADRQVQILADAGIHRKCGEAPWTMAAQAVATAMKGGADPTAGIVAAVDICGAALAEHFPATPGRTHDFSPRPMEV